MITMLLLFSIIYFYCFIFRSSSNVSALDYTIGRVETVIGWWCNNIDDDTAELKFWWWY